MKIFLFITGLAVILALLIVIDEHRTKQIETWRQNIEYMEMVRYYVGEECYYGRFVRRIKNKITLQNVAGELEDVNIEDVYQA